MLPRVILHNAVSADGRLDGFLPDLGVYYGLVSTWNEDAILAGSETILATEAETVTEGDPEPAPPANPPGDPRPLLVVPDSRGRIRFWPWLRIAPYWRDVVVLVSQATPADYRKYLDDKGIDCLVAGEDHVDLKAALTELAARYDVRTVRVDSGGTLNGVLLREGLAEEVSLLIHPHLVGGTSPGSMFKAPDLASPDGALDLNLLKVEQLPGGLVWLRYEVVK
ncbi:MAG: RibD family protein [Chitinophagales bacterium]